jgi:hypothetical protein
LRQFIVAVVREPGREKDVCPLFTSSRHGLSSNTDV